MLKQAVTLSLLCLASVASAEESYSAKSLFFGADDTVVSASTGGPSPATAVVAKSDTNARKTVAALSQKKPGSATRIGASYFIRLKNPDGSTRDVLASQKFKSGDRFQLAVKVSRPSYVYILNEAPDGTIAQVFPQPGADNFVDAMGTVFFPSRGAFEFDAQTGTEQLLVYLSPVPLSTQSATQVKGRAPDLVSGATSYLTQTQLRACAAAPVVAPAAAPAVAPLEAQAPANESIQVASLGSAYASKAIVLSADADANCAQPAQAQAANYASKAITFSDDPAPVAGQQVASYVVKTPSDASDGLYLKLKLVHQ